MLLEKYKSDNLLINSNFLSETGTSGTFGYRGELVLIEGGTGDAKGHAKPPLEVMRGAVLLAGDKLKMVVGALDDIAHAETFFEKYKSDLEADAQILLFVVNIRSNLQIDADGQLLTCIPMQSGIPWNEAIDELRLEKSDFKGQSPADKIVTLWDAMKDWQPRAEKVSMQEALGRAEDIKREVFGAV